MDMVGKDYNEEPLEGSKAPSILWRPILMALLVFISLMPFTALIISQIEQRVDDIAKQKTIEYSRSYATIFELNLQRTLSSAVILGNYIEDKAGDSTNFEREAQILYFSLGGITNLQLAPDAIVQHIFPFRPGDEKAIGHNLIKDDARKMEADLAIRTRTMTVAGPFNLVQGGKAVVGRYPIFVPTDSPFLTTDNTASLAYAEQGNHRFWGYATVLIDFDQMVELTGLEKLPIQGYGFRMWRKHPDTGELDVIAASSEPLSDQKVSSEIQLPNVVWVLEIDQLRDFGKAYGELIRWLTAALVSFIAALSVYFFTLWPERIRQQVKVRTKELDATSGHLATVTSQYESILDSVADGIYGIDSDGKIIFANPAALIAFGGLSTDIVGHSQYENILRFEVNGSEYNEMDCAIKRSIIVQKQIHIYHAVFAKLDGTRFFVEYTCSPLPKGSQQIAAVIVFKDRSERAALEAELSLTSYAFDNTSSAMLITDPKGRILRANHAFTTMTGFPMAEFKDKKLTFFTLAKENQTNYDRISDHVKKTGSWTGEIIAQRKNKNLFTCITTINRVLDSEGVVTNYVAHVQDITQRKEAEKELKEQKNKAEAANKSKSEFLAMMSHEIRTPLSGVMGLLELLSRTSIDTKQKEYIDTAKESAEALLTVINDILDFSKVEADMMELESSVFEPVALMKSVSLLMGPRAQAKGLEFVTESTGYMPEVVTGDPGRIRQILLNLVSNAIKFTTSGFVKVRMTASKERGRKASMIFEVIDSGIGISPDNRTHLFEKFSTVDASYSRRFGGTGLGLSISSQLVTLMGGKIGVDSAIDKGSRFWFKVTLPLAAKDESIFGAKQQPAVTMPVKKGYILVADDVMANRLVIKEVLELAGHEVHLVENGLEAVQAMTLSPFDAILMDVSMPEMDGLQATKAIRDMPNDASTVPIIAMTAHALKGDRERFLAAGMNDYLTKPIQTTELNACLAIWLDQERESKQSSSTHSSQSTTFDSTKMIDVNVLSQMAEDTSRELVPTLVEVFIKDSKSRLVDIKLAFEKSDWPAIAIQAHSMAGSGMAYGLPDLAVLAKAIEYAIKADAIDEAKSHIETYLSQASAHLEALEEYMKGWS